MPFSISTGVYTPVSGSETAQSGQIIASATWNAINTDYANTFNTLGQVLILYNGGMTVPFTTVSVSTSASDKTLTIPISIVPGTGNYYIASAFLAVQSQTITTATVGLYTSASGGGIALISGSLNTVNLAGAAGSANSLQTLTLNAAAQTTLLTSSTLFFNISVAASGNMSVFLGLQGV